MRTHVFGAMATLLLAAAIACADDTAPPPAPPEVSPGQEGSPGLWQFQRAVGAIQAQAGTLLGQPAMTGDWGGWRTWLNDHGVVPNATYFADILGNPIGGKVGKVRYVQDIGVDLLLDFDRMFGLTGSRLRVSMSSRAGANLSADIGNVFTVAEACCSLTTRLVTLAWEQTIIEQRLDLRIGRLSTGDDFLTSPLYVLFVNSDFDANPFSALLNVPYSAYPGATWGARLRGHPIRPIYVAVGVYDGDPTVTRNAAHGTDFSFSDTALFTFEAGYSPGRHMKEVLPGHYKVGGYYHTGRFPRFDAPAGSQLPSAFEYGNGGYYFLVDQMVFRENGDQGLWPFAAVVLAPNEEINVMPVFAGGGITYQGLLPRRDDDVAVVSLAYGGFSSDLRRSEAGSPQGQQDFEMVIEWGYIIHVAPWLHIQPDFQYIVKPGGTGNIPDALVIGAQIGVNL